MLKVIIFALFIIGFCACDDYPIKKANEEYKRLLDKGTAPLEIHEVENEDALQHVIISPPLWATSGVLVRMKVRPGRARFHTSSGIFVPFWFQIDLFNGHIELSFIEETNSENRVDITWSLFKMTTSDAQKNVLQVEPISEEKLDRLLSIQPSSSRFHTTLSITWIKDLLEKGKPLAKDPTKPNSCVHYLGKPTSINDRVYGKLEQLYSKMSKCAHDFVDEGTTSDW